MMVQLTSDGSVAREGFSASYSCVEAPPPPPPPPPPPSPPPPPPPPPPSVQHPCLDIDGSGSVGVDDVLALLAAFGGPAAALNVYVGLQHADTVGVVDLLHLLPDFGRDISNGCVDPVVGETQDYLDPVVTTSLPASMATPHTL